MTNAPAPSKLSQLEIHDVFDLKLKAWAFWQIVDKVFLISVVKAGVE